MFRKINEYFTYQGFKYIKPEKAGNQAREMEAFKALGQAARQEMQLLTKCLDERLTDFKITRVSNWANQAQVGRPHFWCYFMEEESSADDVGIAIRLYGQKDDFGLSVEVSFIERKKSETTLLKQAKVLTVPIAEPLYYMVQMDGESHREEGTETNRHRLKLELEEGKIRKVLLKYDIPLKVDTSLEELVPKILEGFEKVMPYYEVTKN
ncbi:ribonuclease P [Streptococcus saliviloxodontae]|uniref:Uncharacterized protein n=1 Tax=Streptococcus saliviloxodontae TaxID=1349416 RepID=A0ABS2PM09_9STRE|nr:ribonuclease P [Streptococcus saliviloxodontae]MBM7636468.1 hypothetical protein [Streptococcus saliviloxodontae]